MNGGPTYLGLGTQTLLDYIDWASCPFPPHAEAAAFQAAYEAKAVALARGLARYALNATGAREGERRTDFPQPA